jgi:hypothetical protein
MLPGTRMSVVDLSPSAVATHSSPSAWSRIRTAMGDAYLRYLLFPTTLIGGFGLLCAIRYTLRGWGIRDHHEATLALCISIPVACMWVILFEYVRGCA